MKYKMIDKDILPFLLMLFSLIIATIDAINAIDIYIIDESGNDINGSNTDTVSSKSPDNSNVSTSSHRQSIEGGLRWHDVGVSLEKCSQTTNHPHCLDDSMWLLHPTR